jgi:hypothetical protein
LGEIGGLEVFDGDFAHRLAGKEQRQFFPSLFADDGQLPDVRVVLHERDIVPVIAPLPSLEVLGNDEHADVAMLPDDVDSGLLQGSQLGLRQHASDSGSQNAAGVAQNIYAHGSSGKGAVVG